MSDAGALPSDIVADLLAGLQATLPGLIEGFYLSGSVALNDYHPGRSDIDFVAVTSETLGVNDIAALARALRSFRSRRPSPALDGVFLTWRDLAHGPDAVQGPRPMVNSGAFAVSSSGGALNPVSWHTLHRSGNKILGRDLDAVALWHDETRLHTWVRSNVESYWVPWLRRRRSLLTGPGLGALRPWSAEWGVLGICRMHFTLTEGSIASKVAAGTHALDHFAPCWHPIIREAMRIRTGGVRLYRDPFRRRADVLAFMAVAIDAARIAQRRST